MDVLFKEQEAFHDVFEEGLIVFLNAFCSHNDGKHKHLLRNIQEKVQDIEYQHVEKVLG